MMLGKKAFAMQIVVIILIILAVFGIVQIVGEFSKECKKDSECGEERYCGSDFTCHEFKTVEKNIYNVNMILPAIIIGIFIMVAALILRNKKLVD